MAFQKNDFIEIEFTGKIKDTNEVFDSNIQKDLEDSELLKKGQQAKPFVFSLGQGMFLQGIDEFLIGKNTGKYTIELAPEKAFGLRQSQLIQLMPSKIFREQNLRPIPGIVLNFDGRLGKILSVSGGRIRVDFNNPLAGKTVIYNLNVNKKIEDVNEQIKHFIKFLFRRELKFEVQQDKIIIEVEKAMAQFVKLFEEKFKELFGKGLDVKEVEKTVEKLEKSTTAKE